MAGNTINVQGSYIDIHDNENVYLSVDKAEVRMGQQMAADKGGNLSLPEVLTTEKAKEMMTRLVDANILTEQWQPKKLSGAERALVARALSDRLSIADVWQVFGCLWGLKPESLRASFNEALEQKKSLRFQDCLKNIFV